VAFGTSVPEAQAAYDQIEKQVREAFPGEEVRWAYTSKKVRHKLGKQGKRLESPETAMAKLMDEDFTQVVVVSFHAIPGIEFHETYANLSAFERMQGGVEKITVSRPLLSSQQDCKRVAETLLKHAPKDRKPQDALILVGHGTEKHPSYAMYYAVRSAFQELDPKAHVACISGDPSLEDLIPTLKQQGVKKVYLMPFMAVAGEHVRNDLAGDHDKSWKSTLIREGFACEVVPKGIAEYPEIVRIWMDHLGETFHSIQ
jgi:sirohydrochlorin cobaltochelatase